MRALRLARVLLLALLGGFLGDFAMPAASAAPAPVYSNAYTSPRNRERSRRTKTQYIILHTTEGARKGSLVKLRDNGECHYVVDETGIIYRIVDRKKIAYHCGRSMWKGTTDLDRFSIGIEIVGRHNRELTAMQYASLKSLLTELKKLYGVKDENILTHSMVAYDTPNHWHKRNHRGRKRCAMLLADPTRRRKMGVLSKPSFDPDLRAGRLTDADPELTRILYGKAPSASVAAAPAPKAKPAPAPAPAPASPAFLPSSTPSPASKPFTIFPGQGAWDIAKELYNSPKTTYRFPDGTTKKGSEIRNWKALPTGTLVILPSAKPAPAKPTPAPAKIAPAPTPAAPSSEMIIGPKRSAWDIARDHYNLPSTTYRFPNGTVKKGSDIRDWKSLPPGTIVSVSDEDDNAIGGVEIVGRDSSSIRDLVGDEALSASTLYIEPGAKTFRRGSSLTQAKVDALPAGTRVLVQYNVGGPISAKKRAFDICGPSWNRPETYYLTPKGDVIPGNAIGERNIPMGAWVFYRK